MLIQDSNESCGCNVRAFGHLFVQGRPRQYPPLARLTRLMHLARHISHLRLVRFIRLDFVMVGGAALVLVAMFAGSTLLGMSLLL